MASRKKWILLIFKLVLTIVFLILLIRHVGLNPLGRSLGIIHWPLLVAFILAVLFSLLKAFKWHYLLNQNGIHPKFSISLRSYLVGMTFGLMTPGRIGEAGRFLSFSDSPIGLLVTLVILDKIFDIMMVLMLAIPGILYFTPPLVFIFTILLVVIFCLVIARPDWLVKSFQVLVNLFGLKNRFSASFFDISAKLEGLSWNFKLRFLLLTLVIYGVVMIEYFFLVINYHGIGLRIIPLVQPLIMLTNLLPVTIAGLGVREGLASILLTHFDVSHASAANSAFLLFVFNSLLPAILGFPFLLNWRRYFIFKDKKTGLISEDDPGKVGQ